MTERNNWYYHKFVFKHPKIEQSRVEIEKVLSKRIFSSLKLFHKRVQWTQVEILRYKQSGDTEEDKVNTRLGPDLVIQAGYRISGMPYRICKIIRFFLAG